jgi:imidazoleglycerol-phosphate dehydratase
MTPRTVQRSRTTRETDISLTLDPDRPLDGEIRTGLPFFDHLLVAMSFHGRMGLSVTAKGDIDVDPHHLVEDTGLLLGQAFAEVFAKTGAVARFAHEVIPMDEALAEASIDVCGRPTLSWIAAFPQDRAGTFPLHVLREFLVAFSAEARISLHLEVRRGENGHHMAEAAFKALGRALKRAYAPADDAMSSKGRIG